MLTETLPYASQTDAERIPLTSRLKRLSAFGGLLLVVIFFSALRPQTFPTLRNLSLMLTQSVVVAIAALGMTVVIISGGIDLSVAATIASVTMFVATLLNWHFPTSLAALGGVGGACVYGLVIGLLIAKLRLVPFIVTLGTWSAYRAIGKGIGHEEVINTRDNWLYALTLSPSGTWRWTMFSPSVWVLIALALMTAGIMRYTKFGRHVFAIGSNEQTARLCGVPVDRVKILVYVFNGALAGVAGVLQFAYVGQGDPTTAMGMELYVIAAVVIGGASLNGGQGTILGTLIGAAIMTVINNGCTKLGLQNWVQEIVTGGIIILANALDRLQHRREE